MTEENDKPSAAQPTVDIDHKEDDKGHFVLGGESGATPEGDIDYGAVESKKLAAGLCGILVGSFGIHKFILGYPLEGCIMLGIWVICLALGMCLIIPIAGCIIIQVIGITEGIIYLSKPKEKFYEEYILNKRTWF